jgi:MarR family transcriptional regulator, lower aerobic nicotinate degradation pathway regulator
MSRQSGADRTFAFDDPKKALDYLQARPGFLLRRAQQILTSLLNAECQRVGIDITESQLDALTLVASEPHPDQITLARRLGYDRSSTTSIIDGLTRRRLVRRRIAGDRRRRSIELATGALNTLNKAHECSRRAENKLFSRVSRNKTEQIMDVLEEVAMNSHSAAPNWEPLDPVQRPGLKRHHHLHAIYRTPRFLMGRCIQIGRSFLYQEIGNLGFMGGGQFGMLFLIAALGPVDQATLARVLRLDKSSVSIILSTLQARGVVDRAGDPCDRRRFLVNTTHAGLRLLRQACPRAARADERVFEGLRPGTRRRFIRLLSCLVSSHSGFVTGANPVSHSNRSLGLKADRSRTEADS